MRTPQSTSTGSASLARVVGIACAASIGALMAPAVAEARCAGPTVAEAELARLVNRARRAHDVRPLVVDPELRLVSRVHSAEMERRNTLYHTSSRTLGRRITNWTRLGENISYISTRTTRTQQERARTVFRAFMRSPRHRQNILHPGFRYHGVGTTSSGTALWFTNTFHATRNPGTRLTALRC